MANEARILLVEDDVLIGMMLVDMLGALGHAKPQIAATPDAALAVIAKGGISAALIDINLGDEKAWPVADALAEAGIAFAFSSGGGDTVPAEHRDRPQVSKPFRLSDIESLFDSLLG